MTEVIKVLEKKVQELRNQIAGAEKNIEKAEENLSSENIALSKLRQRELDFLDAIDKLKKMD
jgi:flagellar biosynthesis chaperone FliJ